MSAAAKPEATIGVGDGSGQLFVHGSHEAVKRVQSIILEVERLQDVVARLSPSDEETRYTADQDWTGLSGATAWHLAERHGEGWAGIGAMMEAWRDAEVQRITAGLAADLARAQEQAQAEPVAWVPMHPRVGALWAMTTATPSEERLPSHYPLSPLYASSAPAAAPERAADLGENIIEAQRAQVRTLTAERDELAARLDQTVMSRSAENISRADSTPD